MFAAKYPGTCRQGQDDIKPGDEIERLDGGYAHVKCPPNPQAGMSRPPMKTPRQEAVEQVLKAAKAAVELEPGMYTDSRGEIFKVQRGRESGNLYAKWLKYIGGERLVDATGAVVNFEFEYAPGAIKHLAEDGHRMSLEEAKAFGLRFGVCCVCGAFLKDATSVANGIGPVCGKRV